MITDNNRKNIIIPVEIQNREMLAKLYIGAVAARHGYDVVVGDQKEIANRFFELKPGVYLDKSVAKTKRHFFQKLKKLGFAPVAMCEEGLVYRDKTRYLRERVDPETFGHAHVFYCWGEKQRTDVKCNILGKEKLLVTGNPRFDLLRPEFRQIWREESAHVRNKIGKFVLINTNFSRFNRLPGTDNVIELLKKRGTLDPQEGSEYYRGLIQHLADVMTAFLEAIPKIACCFPDHKIIIRPHPSENNTPYKALAVKYQNIKVDSSGSVIPWLIASDAVVHNSCTTGIEGWILDRPVISYMPKENTAFDSELPNRLSYICCSVNELLDKLDYVIAGNIGAKRDADTTSIAEHYIHSLNGPMAAEYLVSQLPEVKPSSTIFLVVKEKLVAIAKTCLRKVPGLRIPQGLTMLAKQKFPGFDLQEATTFIHALGLCKPELKGVYITKISGWKNVFYISAR